MRRPRSGRSQSSGPRTSSSAAAVSHSLSLNHRPPRANPFALRARRPALRALPDHGRPRPQLPSVVHFPSTTGHRTPSRKPSAIHAASTEWPPYLFEGCPSPWMPASSRAASALPRNRAASLHLPEANPNARQGRLLARGALPNNCLETSIRGWHNRRKPATVARRSQGRLGFSAVGGGGRSVWKRTMPCNRNPSPVWAFSASA